MHWVHGAREHVEPYFDLTRIRIPSVYLTSALTSATGRCRYLIDSQMSPHCSVALLPLNRRHHSVLPSK